jgi:hypothetical protein
MNMEIETLYKYLKEHCTVQHMKELALGIIDLYKSKDYRTLSRMMERIVPGSSPEGTKGNTIFFALIKYFHPDRHAAIMKDIDDSHEKGDEKKLGFYQNIFFNIHAKKTDKNREFFFEAAEEYGYDVDDLGFDESDYTGNLSGDDLSESEGEFDFYSAVKSALYGNLDFEIGPEDLEFLAGVLDLSDYGIDDIDGIEHCLRVTSLNLSDNRISHIECLSELRELYLANNEISDIEYLHGLCNLEILDLAGNEIEDASVLLDLEHLQFVDIADNPLVDRAVIAALKERSVVVIE